MELVEVYNTWNEQKAELIKEILGDYDISCYLSSHITRSVLPFAGQEEIRIMVPKNREKRSRKIIKDYFSREDEEKP
ncbi:MAG: putative signal transducing protein [Candidatus Bipolaricaulia bacterium]